MRRQLLGLFASVGLVAACSSSEPDSGGASGSFQVKDGTFIRNTIVGDQYTVILADVAPLCQAFADKTCPAALNEFRITLDNPTTVTAGTFDVVIPGEGNNPLIAPAAGTAWVFYNGLSKGGLEGGGFATGTLILTRVDDHVAGSYDLKFASGFIQANGGYGPGQASGTFDSVDCGLDILDTTYCK
ncbi:MAG: hypothetical protein U0263_17630 [Polyangiaceae bacterium]